MCRVRFRKDGVLRVPRGYVGALQCDPIEKKPFFHALPGSDALSFGMLGCDLHCGYCQNWFTSQSIRDPNAVGEPRDVAPEQLAELAVEYGAPTVVSTYNEPLITSEWAVEVFRAAKARGLRTAYVSLLLALELSELAVLRSLTLATRCATSGLALNTDPSGMKAIK